MTFAAFLQDEVSRSPLWLQVARDAGQAFQAWITPFLIAGGGLFAYYRFRRGRAFRSRLKVEISGRVERATGLTGTEGLLYLVVTTTVTNIGDGAVTVDETLLALESLDAPPETARPPWVAGWSDLLSESGIVLGLSAFEGAGGEGRTLEPEEPVEDRTLIGLPDAGYGAIRVTATAASTSAGRSWTNDEVVITAVPTDNGDARKGARQIASEGGPPS